MDYSPRPTEQTPSVAADSNYFVTEPLPAPDAADPGRPGATPRRLWLDRLALVLFVALCIELGVLLTVLPWYGRIWTDNSFIIVHPLLRAFAADNFVRGLVTGLGVINIWLGIWEAAHYREPRPQPPSASR